MEKKFKFKKICPLLLCICSVIMGIGYASVNSVILDISGKVTSEIQKGVFITDVTYYESTEVNKDSSSIKSYYGTMINGVIKLQNNDNSSITYSVTVYNNSNDIYIYDGIKYQNDKEFYSNSNIVVESSGIDLKERLLPNQSKTFTIKFHYLNNKLQSNNELSYYINTSFKKLEKYSIIYNNIDNTSSLPTEIIEGESLNITFQVTYPKKLEITMDGNSLTLNKDYTYNSGNLKISNVTGDIVISNGDNSSSSLPDKKDLVITFHSQGGDTSGGTYNYAFTLKNATSKNSTHWVIYILVPSDTKISSSWGCSASVENGVLIIKDANWNGTISAGSSAGYVAGIIFTTSDSSVLPFKYASEIS